MNTKPLLLKLSIIKSHTDKYKNFADVSKLLGEVIITIRELEKKTSAEYIRSRQRNALKAYVALAKLEFYTEFEEIIPSIMSEKLDRLIDEILEDPTAKPANKVDIVYCRECKWRNRMNDCPWCEIENGEFVSYVTDNDFCSMGEREDA